MRPLQRLTLLLSVTCVALGVGASPAAAAFTWQGQWNIPEFAESWSVTGNDRQFEYRNVTNPGTAWENTYAIVAERTSTTPLVFTGTLDNSGEPGKHEQAFSGTVEFKVNFDGTSFDGTITYGSDSGALAGNVDKISGSCTAGACTRNTPVWPALADPTVPLATVANGCGPGTAGSKPRYFDTSKYWDPPTQKSYTVNFRTACDMHDAAYNGSRVKDPFNDDRTVDFFKWWRHDIDLRFLKDMRTLCREQVPASATTARTLCMNNGGTFSTGALTRYRAVKAVGHRSFVARPKLAGSWVARDLRGKPKPFWQIRQSNRILLASWKKPGNTGSFRGIIVSKDGQSLIRGFSVSKVNGVTRFGATLFVWNPKTPNRVRLTGAMGGLVLTR